MDSVSAGEYPSSRQSRQKSRVMRVRIVRIFQTVLVVSIALLVAVNFSMHRSSMRTEISSQNGVLWSLQNSQGRNLEVHETLSHQTVQSPNSKSTEVTRVRSTPFRVVKTRSKEVVETSKKKRRARKKRIDLGDPLRAPEHFLNTSRKPLNFSPAPRYLGVLIDGGRHFFPIPWLMLTIDRLADMRYNLIHFRLTDDQAFNVLLQSHPELAYPAATNNGTPRAVYTAAELRNLTAYAKSKGIQIMPEINVPGHGGAWAGIPGLVAQCVTFICSTGYGVPLNVTHPAFRGVLTNVLREIVDIFDDPPFLHLGGDEVDMATPCFEELDVEVFDYSAFEKDLQNILKDIDFPEDRVVRWEISGKKEKTHLLRTGGILHFWQHLPGTESSFYELNQPFLDPFFLSTGLYFDTNGDHDAIDVYKKTRRAFNLIGGYFPKAIIAGTFELSTEFWFDRNVLGRLLAVSLGVANTTVDGVLLHTHTGGKAVEAVWTKSCHQLGLGDLICGSQGKPIIGLQTYERKWREGWEVWKRDICDRVANLVSRREIKKILVLSNPDHAVKSANEFFWDNFPFKAVEHQPMNLSLDLVSTFPERLRAHRVENSGVILDISASKVDKARLETVVQDEISRFGFNLIQLPLVNNNGFAYRSSVQHQLSYPQFGLNTPHPIVSMIEPLVRKARALGMDIMPEVSISSDAAGWIKSNHVVNCAEHFCGGKGLPTDINSATLPPILYSVLGELRKIFSSKFIHLGSDERKASQGCFKEAGYHPDFDQFESKMSTLLRVLEVPTTDILRWSNVENERYSNRTGEITMYRPGAKIEMPTPVESREEPMFVTIDILDGSAFNIFNRTRSLITRLKPLGVMAQIRHFSKELWTETQTRQRLLAYAMGLSKAIEGFDEEDSFSETFSQLCAELGWNECNAPKALKTSFVPPSETAEFVQRRCDLVTKMAKGWVAAEVSPYYEDLIRTKAYTLTSNKTFEGINNVHSFHSTLSVKKGLD